MKVANVSPPRFAYGDGWAGGRGGRKARKVGLGREGGGGEEGSDGNKEGKGERISEAVFGSDMSEIWTVFFNATHDGGSVRSEAGVVSLCVVCV